MNDVNRDQARQFLEDVRTRLEVRLYESEASEGTSIAKQIEQIRIAARQDAQRKHLKAPEAAFLNTWAVQALRDQLLAQGLSTAEAKAALLAESHAAFPEIVGGPAARPMAFPFTKAMNAKSRDIYDRWAGRKGSQTPFPTTWPDLAIRQPHRIVFEGKYFESGSLEFAERQLVSAIHEAVFYLGVPAVNARGREWGYDFACLVAFDASEDGALLSAWSYLQAEVAFWESANLFVIVAAPPLRERMSVSAYEALFCKLGFTSFESHKKLQHPAGPVTLYFNRNRAGVVSFAVYAKDRERFDRRFWDFIPAQQKKDEDPALRTVVPKPGREEKAFRDLLKA